MKLPELLLSLILLLAPFFRGLYHEQEMLVFQTAVFIAFAAFLFYNRRIHLNKLMDFAAVAFILSYLASLPGAADLREAVLAVMRVLAYFMIYVMVSAKAGDSAFRRRLLASVYLSGTVVEIGVLMSLGGIISTSQVMYGNAIQTTFQYKNAGALFLLLCTLIGIYFWNRSDSLKLTLLIGAGNFLNMLFIMGTQSRAVWLLSPVAFLILWSGVPAGKRITTLVKTVITLAPAVLFSNQVLTLFQQEAVGQALIPIAIGIFAALAGLYGWLRLEKQVGQMQKAVTAVTVLVIVAVLAGGVFSGSSRLAARMRSVADFDFNVQERLVFYRDASKIISQHPILGSGGKAWDILYLNIQSYGYYAENVHNDFLQTAVEAGTAGLLAFLTLWGAFFVSCLKFCFRTDHDEQREVAWLVLAAGVTVFLHTLFDFDLAHSALAFVLWSLFGMARSGVEPQHPPGQTPSWRSPLFIGVLAAGIIYSMVSLSFFTGDMFFAKGEKLIESGDLITTRDYFMKAESLDPWNANTLASLAQIDLALYQGGEPSALDKALRYAQKAIAVRPNEPLSHSVYATALLYSGDYAKSAAESQRFVQLHPMLTAAYEELAYNYMTAGISLAGRNSPEARTYFGKTLEVEGMVKTQMSKLTAYEIEMWKMNSSEPVLTVSPRIKVLTGAANLFLGNSGPAGKQIAEAFKEDPESPEVLLWNAVILDLQGNKNESRVMLDKASAQNPGIAQSYEDIIKLANR
ncbi:MAG: O-antigen ligase family protein [Eubacteriales bacterium]